jgi:conjugative relaxase-like TrwC/TraI family protein
MASMTAFTGEQLVRHKTARECVNEGGETVRTMQHRAGWDATFSAPKSVSLTALVGGDQEVRQAHRESVKIALDELERYVQARMGGNYPPETTGKWVAATFEHDSARPVDGYAAPQLHTHVVFFNVWTGGFQVLACITLDLRLAALALLDFVSQLS